MPQVFIAEQQQIECAGKSQMVITSAVKYLKGWNAFTVGANNLRIHDRGHIESRRLLKDKGIAITPIVSIHRVEPHTTITDMDLKSIAVMLQFMPPAWAAWRPGSNRWTAWLDKGGRCVVRPAK
jgi:hypothetical protein